MCLFSKILKVLNHSTLMLLLPTCHLDLHPRCRLCRCFLGTRRAAYTADRSTTHVNIVHQGGMKYVFIAYVNRTAGSHCFIQKRKHDQLIPVYCHFKNCIFEDSQIPLTKKLAYFEYPNHYIATHKILLLLSFSLTPKNRSNVKIEI